MFLILQVVFTILAVICIASIFPVGTFLGWGWAGLCALVAILFFVLMRIFKTQNELSNPTSNDQEGASQEGQSQGNNGADFFHPVHQENNEKDE